MKSSDPTYPTKTPRSIWNVKLGFAQCESFNGPLEILVQRIPRLAKSKEKNISNRGHAPRALFSSADCQAALATWLRLARSLDQKEEALARIATAVGKYYVSWKILEGFRCLEKFWCGFWNLWPCFFFDLPPCFVGCPPPFPPCFCWTLYFGEICCLCAFECFRARGLPNVQGFRSGCWRFMCALGML